MALVRRSYLLAVLAVAATGLAGCTGPGSQQARDENQKMDTLTRCGDELARKDAVRPILVARSQMPETPETLPATRVPAPGRSTVAADPVDRAAPGIVAPPPRTTPAAPAVPAIRPVSASSTAPPPETGPQGDSQVKIVASIGNNPIYDAEVREAVYQRMGEFARLPESQRLAKEKEVYREELRRIIERELILDEMFSALSAKKQTAALAKLKDAASKEAEARLKEFKKDRNIPSDAEFRSILRSQGLTLAGIRRQIERNFMMHTYLRDKHSNKFEVISLATQREYYDTHLSEFQAEDRVKWLDLFVLTERFKSAAEAKQYAEHFAARGAKGEDFVKLATQHSMGDSKLRSGAGIGEKPGEIFPQELESTVLGLKAGQVTIHPTENGFHVIKVIERTHKGPKPYDDKLQAEIKQRIQQQIFQRETKRLAETLWKKVQPQIWVEL